MHCRARFCFLLLIQYLEYNCNKTKNHRDKTQIHQTKTVENALNVINIRHLLLKRNVFCWVLYLIDAKCFQQCSIPHREICNLTHDVFHLVAFNFNFQGNITRWIKLLYSIDHCSGLTMTTVTSVIRVGNLSSPLDKVRVNLWSGRWIWSTNKPQWRVSNLVESFQSSYTTDL